MENETILCACGCGQPVKKVKYPSQRQAKFINTHQHKGRNNGNYRGGKVSKACGICGESFEVVPAVADTRKTCGKSKCVSEWQRIQTSNRGINKISVACDYCGKTLAKWPSQVKGRNYCNRKCQNLGHGQETKDDNHHNWNGGSSANWIRKKVKERDGNRCIICGFDFCVQIHHITPRNKGGTNDFHNMITLCPNHHKMADLGIIDVEHLRNHDYKPAPGFNPTAAKDW